MKPEKCSISSSEDIGYSYDCSNRGLQDIPKDLDKNTTIIDLSYNLLKELPAFICHTYHFLQTLNMTNNIINRIHVSAFINCSRLADVFLANNVLTDYPAKAFAPLSGLKTLQLVYNNIRNISSMLENICSNLYSLVHLDVDVFTDFVFPRNCKHLTNFTSVYLLVHTSMHFRSNSFFYLAGLPITELCIEHTGYSAKHVRSGHCKSGW